MICIKSRMESKVPFEISVQKIDFIELGHFTQIPFIVFTLLPTIINEFVIALAHNEKKGLEEQLTSDVRQS